MLDWGMAKSRIGDLEGFRLERKGCFGGATGPVVADPDFFGMDMRNLKHVPNFRLMHQARTHGEARTDLNANPL